MPEKYSVELVYHTVDKVDFELPEGKTWNDIKEWYVKWGTFHYKLKDDDIWHEVVVDGTLETDYKYPIQTFVNKLDDDGEFLENIFDDGY